ncbi:hypothetical protein K239x_29600 [Planctomycetes bacterium K23_9]|uniref:Uncharacterized protein n=1 Tax=Stieleria marina TaxID=1930275 RepID=A0A517NV18_9BACT|nr:hypothetical protein K239x_29600 [Planctomycetes bacterium K23_9]
MHGRTACVFFEVESQSSVLRDVYRSANGMPVMKCKINSDVHMQLN